MPQGRVCAIMFLAEIKLLQLDNKQITVKTTHHVEGVLVANKRKTYSGQFKAEIVLELLKGKKTLAELATEHEVHPNQIKNWKSAFLRQASVVLEDKRKSKKEAE